MIAFPIAAALTAFICAAVIGWDAARRPRPERIIWMVAFLVFAVAATAEVIGSSLGWSAILARLYYLAGAVLVVGILALGELYLLFPGRMPTFVPGVTLLVVAIAATAVWGAPVDMAALRGEGWRAIDRGPFLITLAATINAGGTAILVGGALYSAWTQRAGDSKSRLAGCVLIAAGTVIVALGGTLTRFGRDEYLYLAMALGIAVIFAGVLLTRRAPVQRSATETTESPPVAGSRHGFLISLPARNVAQIASSASGEGIRYILEQLLPLDDDALAAACRRWSATTMDSDDLSRTQAHQVWSLRLALPRDAEARFDGLSLATQTQLAELYAEVWSSTGQNERRA